MSEPSITSATICERGGMPGMCSGGSGLTRSPGMSVVFALLRNALGIQQVPPNIVINSLALIFTFYVMAPVGLEITERLEQRGLFDQGRMKTADLFAALADAREPLRTFMIDHGKERERKFFLRTAEKIWPPERAAAIDLRR